jgi:hypothetical protein
MLPNYDNSGAHIRDMPNMRGTLKSAPVIWR